MEQSKKPLWKRSILQNLNLYSIMDQLQEILDNGDPDGYESASDESGYYAEYKPFFDELAAGAYGLMEALADDGLQDNWDDMTVALLGETQTVLGYDEAQMDYFGMLSPDEDWATEVARKRIERMTKREMIQLFRRVLAALMAYCDLKAAHDCLTSIVQELDERAVLLNRKNEEIDRVYTDLTGAGAAEFDRIIANLPQRMWVE